MTVPLSTELLSVVYGYPIIQTPHESLSQPGQLRLSRQDTTLSITSVIYKNFSCTAGSGFSGSIWIAMQCRFLSYISIVYVQSHGSTLKAHLQCYLVSELRRLYIKLVNSANSKACLLCILLGFGITNDFSHFSPQ